VPEILSSIISGEMSRSEFSGEVARSPPRSAGRRRNSSLHDYRTNLWVRAVGEELLNDWRR
jgi:hypothetical protein